MKRAPAHRKGALEGTSPMMFSVVLISHPLQSLARSMPVCGLSSQNAFYCSSAKADESFPTNCSKPKHASFTIMKLQRKAANLYI